MSEADKRQTPRDTNLNELFDMIRAASREMGELSGRFIGHMDAEEEHYENIRGELRGIKQEVVKLGNKVEGLEILQKAFPKDENGQPRIEEHHDEHAERFKDKKASSNRWNKLKEHAMLKAFDIAAVVVGVVLLLGLQTAASTWITKTFQTTQPAVTAPAK